MDDPLIRGIANAQIIRRSSLGGLMRRSRSTEIKSKKNKQTVARELELEKERQYQLKIALHSNPPTAFHVHKIPKSEKSSISNESCLDVATIVLPPIEVENVAIQLPNFARSASLISFFLIKLTNLNLVKSSGKTSFLNFLKSTLASPPKTKTTQLSNLREDIFAPPYPRIGSFEKHEFEAKIDTDRINLTLWDSKGLEKENIKYQIREIISFIEGKFEDTFREELKVIRAPICSRDTHIHVVFLLLDPLSIEQGLNTLKSSTLHDSWLNEKSEYSTFDLAGRMEEDVEIKVIRALQGKAIVLPIISKADIITSAHMAFLKKNIREKLWKANLDLLDAFETEDDDKDLLQSSNNTNMGSNVEVDAGIRSPRIYETVTSTPKVYIKYSDHTDKPTNYLENSALPFSIISPDLYEPDIIGRRFPWGLANPLNSEHCEFIHLKNNIFYEWREELRDVCWKVLYENWRTNRFLQYLQQ
ncbi:putative p-loop containing nucleoside triphosphate hydrolase [Erysiphe neolycopersici]|uniref:Putative p-loop containing nucleoside triphosphate hydrolase n=1 Tax=Erysiphe neolycopersici TaxID=212602 RepID=A0A420I4S5_9PEZI|nr:putative p-loop containing nucleoside triphosphate hydrolase [Erysiphe neolycopersici]